MNHRALIAALVVCCALTACTMSPKDEQSSTRATQVERYGPRDGSPTSLFWPSKGLRIWFSQTATLYLDRAEDKVVLLSAEPLEVMKPNAREYLPKEAPASSHRRQLIELENGTLIQVDYDPSVWHLEPLAKVGIRIVASGFAPSRP